MTQRRIALQALAVAVILLIGTLSCIQSATNAAESSGQENVDQAKGGDSETSSDDPFVRSEIERNIEPVAGEDEIAELVTGNTEFAFELYQWLVQSNDNLIFSPYSISTALAMAYAGADGQTKTDMAGVLHFTMEDDSLHDAFNAVDLILTAPPDEFWSEMGEPFRLNIANALWMDHRRQINPEFLDTVAWNYGTGMGLLGFVDDPVGSSDVINAWIDNETEGRIPDAITPDLIGPLTIMILVNAIYFHAGWGTTFDEDFTEDEPFYRLTGDEVTVPMMKKIHYMGYADGDGWQALRIPYMAYGTSMVILLPESGRFGEFEGALDGSMAMEIMDELDSEYVELRMPRFEYKTDLLLKQTLAEMGMNSAFEGGFESIILNPRLPIFIDEVIHKAFISVDEEGTEAAAATVVVFAEGESEAPPEPIMFTVDRPFIFFIVDEQTGSILFIGRVLDPTTG